MQFFASDAHRSHHALELDGSEIIPSWEQPSRADVIAGAIRQRHQHCEPAELDDTVLTAVHDADYVEFIRTAFERWHAEGERGAAAMGGCWPARRMGGTPRPTAIRGQLGYYGFAADCSITAGTWAAVAASAAIAQSATAAVLDGERAAFALCRPPGHHASRDQFGGYCYLNNAAIAAAQLLAAGSGRVALVDIDYHHGNGTQDIFYDRDDVYFCSVHADPAQEFPYFIGYADETGRGTGQGYTRNLPLPWGTPFDRWLAALDRGLDEARQHGCEALVVSLGVDTFAGDPISHFCLTTDDYPTIGARLAGLDVPTVLVMEGGYAVDALGRNVAGVLDGFEDATPAQPPALPSE